MWIWSIDVIEDFFFQVALASRIFDDEIHLASEAFVDPYLVDLLEE